MTLKFLLLPSNVYQLLHNYFYASQFACAALAIRARLKLLNDYSSSFVHNKKEFRVVVHQKKFNLKLFSKLYNDLCDLIELLNKTFTWQLIFVMINLMLVDIFTAYGVVREFIEQRAFKLKFLIITNTIWSLLQFAIKYIMAYCGNSTTDEAENSLLIVTRIIEKFGDDDEKMKTDLNHLLNQMQGRNKNLENVFFAINYKLILAVSVVAHLLISFASTRNFDDLFCCRLEI